MNNLHIQADLPAQLGVDLVHCEKQADKVVEGSNGTIRIIQGEILTDAYFDGIAIEIGETLQVNDAALSGHKYLFSQS